MDRFPNRVRPAARPRVRRTPLATGACVALTVLLAACGGGGGDEPAADLNDPTQGPLAKLLGFDISPADQRAKELELQQVLVECMKAEGWEYQPVDYSSMGGGFEDEYEEQISDPEAYGEKYGYGVVRGYELQPSFGTGTEFEDPNADYMNSLTMAEQQEYNAALYGEQSFSDDEAIDSGEATEFVMPSLEEQGCYGTAQLEVYGDSPFNDPDMQERLNELFEDSESDPAVTEDYESWASCMTDRDPSYEYTNPSEVINGLYDRLNTLQGFEPFDEEGDSGSGVIVSGTSGGLSDDQPEIDEADLEELRQDELTTWADDWACQQEVDLAQVRRDVEQRLADDLVAEFPELGEG